MELKGHEAYRHGYDAASNDTQRTDEPELHEWCIDDVSDTEAFVDGYNSYYDDVEAAEEADKQLSEDARAHYAGLHG